MQPDARGCSCGTLDHAAVEDAVLNDGAVDDVFDAKAFVHKYDCFVLFVGEIIFRIQGRGECGSRGIIAIINKRRNHCNPYFMLIRLF